jgi:hypothetical protein
MQVIAALKSAGTQSSVGQEEAQAASAWISRISYLDKEISKQQALLAKLAHSSGSVISK